MSPLILLGSAWLVWRWSHASRRRNPSRRRRNIAAFTDSSGVVHPIRDSKGYDPGVDEVQRQVHERRALENRMSHHRSERSDIHRPPWAVGISDQRLGQIAREFGTTPYRERWWDTVGLSSGSGELRYLLEGRAQTVRRRAAATRTRRVTSASRRRRGLTREQRRAASGDYSDIPF